MRKLILILFVLLIYGFVLSQENEFELYDCFTLDIEAGYIQKSGGNLCSDNKPTNNSTLYKEKYAQMSHWIPHENDEDLSVRIAFHVFNDNQGNGTDYPDNQETLDMVNQMLSWLNSKYNNCSPSHPITGVNNIVGHKRKNRATINNSTKKTKFLTKKLTVHKNVENSVITLKARLEICCYL